MSEKHKTVTPEEAQQWFEYFALRKDMAPAFNWNGCFARAHLICSVMQAHGLDTRKIWVASDMETPRQAEKMDVIFHVAPCLMVVGKNGTAKPVVIDPVFYPRPVSPKVWTKGMKATQFLITDCANPQEDRYYWNEKYKRSAAMRDQQTNDTLSHAYAFSMIHHLKPRRWVTRIRKEKSLALVPMPNMTGTP
ncbi:MAG TPA: hypothetical protein DCW68_07640 [Rhodospirillaceae bacterium]|nr:MAG: hypothetical protein A2018_08140 [Alphaproteobacteria bacterium GWF2_58_20]HAU29959.1 hypothetical protein [Rhodospirillaceae bacterium]